MKKLFILLFVLMICNTAQAVLQVKTTLPELNWLAESIGGSYVKTSSLLSGHEDPHFVDVTPSFIFKIKKIDILIKNGLDLESTWLPKIIELSGNKKLLSGGVCDASSNLDTLGKLNKVDRSMGDVHAKGNPHYTYSPKQMILAAESMTKCFQKIDEKNFKIYEANFNQLKLKLEKLHGLITKKLSKLKRFNLMTYHEEFKYFCHDYKLSCLNTVEDTPGVLPSASSLVRKTLFAKKNKVNFVLATDNNSKKILEKFKELTGIGYIQIDAHMNTQNDSYIHFVMQIVKALEKNEQ